MGLVPTSRRVLTSLVTGLVTGVLVLGATACGGADGSDGSDGAPDDTPLVVSGDRGDRLLTQEDVSMLSPRLRRQLRADVREMRDETREHLRRMIDGDG